MIHRPCNVYNSNRSLPLSLQLPIPCRPRVLGQTSMSLPTLALKWLMTRILSSSFTPVSEEVPKLCVESFLCDRIRLYCVGIDTNGSDVLVVA